MTPSNAQFARNFPKFVEEILFVQTFVKKNETLIFIQYNIDVMLTVLG